MSNIDSIELLRALCRGEFHPGYTWVAIMSNGDYLCVSCLRENYRQVFRATRDGDPKEWAVAAYYGSDWGESESTVYCAHCHKLLWEQEPELREPDWELNT